jgi:hypothetical protein
MSKVPKLPKGVYFYYLRFDYPNSRTGSLAGGRHPFGVVVFMRSPADPTKVVRGISLRSEKDVWDKVGGIKRAYGRMLKAYNCECCAEVIQNFTHYSVINFLDNFKANFPGVDSPDSGPFMCKSAFNVPPSSKEVRILEIGEEQVPDPVVASDAVDAMTADAPAEVEATVDATPEPGPSPEEPVAEPASGP